MSTKDALRIIAKYHTEWIQKVKALFGNNYVGRNFAEDMVQNMYVKLSKYDNLAEKVIKEDGTLSDGYIYFVLKNMTLNYLVKKTNLKFDFLGNDYDFAEVYDYVDEDQSVEVYGENKLSQSMWDSLNENLHWFDVKILKMYLFSGLTYNKISEQTNISYQTIFLSIKKCKEHLRDNFKESWEDYLNNDFDKL